MVQKEGATNTIAIVVFITILIWVYADLALDEPYDISKATISIIRPPEAQLWVSFEDESSTFEIQDLTLTGPASRITQFGQSLNEGNISLDFPLLPNMHGISGPGNWTVSVSSVISDNERMRDWGLMVESSEPEEIVLSAVELIPRQMPVVCTDENGGPLAGEQIEPATVEVLVPSDWMREVYVRLTSEEIRQARSFAIDKTPSFRVGEEVWQAQSSVKVTMPQDALDIGTIQNVKLGIIFSQVTQGKYRVEVENLTEVLGPITVQSTPAAKEAYGSMLFQVILEIDDSLEGEIGTVLEKELIYNLPSEYVSKGEIVAPQTPVIAKFELIPI
ncbi:MAG: hypothetical protein ACYTE8_13365, partial [Planctomycetota bacterium]